MDPRDFQQLGHRLSAGATTAERRTAVGRAYYAAFNVGAAWLRALAFPVGKGAAAHGEVQRCLANSGHPDLDAVASQLGDLHTERNRADYQLDRTDIEHPAKAPSAVRLSADMIQVMDQLFTGPEKPKLEAAIHAWRKANGYPT
jgi:hypothetical protein